MHRLTASVYSELSSTLHRHRGRSEVGPCLARSGRREASLGYLGRGEVSLGPGLGSVALVREVGGNCSVLPSCHGGILGGGGGSLLFVLIGALVTCSCERSGRHCKSAL